jgi:CRISPR/Cas system endoribonuclease Cas6 (RAMP superfamily)
VTNTVTGSVLGSRYPLEIVRVKTHLGTGTVVYFGLDRAGGFTGWTGIRLDGETRVDEYPPEAIERL